MVLCAGLGTRLGDLTREIPKPMLPLHGQPLLAYLLSNLRSQGFNDVAVNLHFRPEVISDWFGDGSSWQMQRSGTDRSDAGRHEYRRTCSEIRSMASDAA